MPGLYKQIIVLKILFMFCYPVWADNYDPLLLRAQAAIYPKIILLDQDLSTKAPDGEVVLSIVSSEQSESQAQQLKDLINEKYSNKLGNRKLTVHVTTFNKVKQEILPTAYIVMQGSELLFTELVSHAISHGRIVFSYNYTDFKYNTLISLLVKEKTYIYLNKSAVQLYDIKFSPVFYKLVKIIE